MRSAVAAVLLAIGALAISAAPANAQGGRVVVFQSEFQPLTQYADPAGCYNMPALAHVIDNLTSRPIKLYTAPNCLGPYLQIRPDYGSHIHGLGSFSA
jgi:hypothetical protein